MAEIYVYDKRCDDFANFGLVGALTPASCVFEEEANGLSEITLEHPIDDFGRYTALQVNNLLVAEVPVRTTPEIENGSIVTAVELWEVRAANSVTKAQRTLYKKKTGSAKIKVLPSGTEVTVVSKPDEGRYKVKCRYGTGWMMPDGLEFEYAQTIADNSQSIESVQPAWTVKPQVFRIYSVEKNIDSLTVSARHISYDLLYNLTTYKNDGEIDCKTALAAILDGCAADHEFEGFTNLSNIRTGIDWTRINPISALLDPENGLTALYGAALVRDNWELYVLHDPGLNRGVTVEYGKNMTGIKHTESFDNVVTRIIPVGETKAGDPLLLAGNAPWVDSNRINNYPVVYVQELQCENCKVGTNGVTESIARARMAEQALAVFEDGGDLPQVELSVDFVNLGDTEEYRQFRNLERLFLWDYVTVRHKLLDIDVTSRVVSIRWDCLLDRMVSMEVGSVGKTLANSGITTWQIPTGFSGSKIAGGTIGNAALKSDIIAARHVQAESINTEALQAESVTSEKLAAGSVTAEKIEAGAIDTASLEAITAKIESLTASDIEADRLAAALAAFTVVTAATASFDLETVKNLVSEALTLREGSAGSMYITNLAVTSANILNATIGDLIIKGEDGGYYQIIIDSSGNIKTVEVTVSEEEIAAGKTETGKQIAETTINVQQLNAQNILAASAIITELFTDLLNAGTITAVQASLASAVIPELYTTAVNALGDSMRFEANELIQFILGSQNEMNRWFTFDVQNGLSIRKPAYTDDNGVVHPGSVWSTVVDEKGFHIKRSDAPGYIGSFHEEQLDVKAVSIGGVVCREMYGGGWVWTDE